jgi:glycosyltransferase involved in cell wall biosynthesis
MAELTVIIPSRKEKFLQQTIEDIKQHAEGDIEILYEEDEGLGQRALLNKLARKATGKYIMKCDAHCSFSQGFDVKMIAQMDDKTILSPILMPLYENWTINGKKQMCQFAFDTDFVMQHIDGDVGETMCLQGSCWMITKENYFKWNVCDESLGSWGGQAVELGIRAFLNGGRCITTRDAYYGHIFRHTDSEFPYDRGESPGKLATERLKGIYFDKIGGLIEKFNFPCDWKKFLLDKGTQIGI